MYGRALLGAGLGAGSGAAVSDPKDRTRNMLIGAGLGAGLGAGSKLLAKPKAALNAPSAGGSFKPVQKPIEGAPKSTALSKYTPSTSTKKIDSFTPPKGEAKRFEESLAQARSEGFQGSKKEFYDDVFNAGKLDDMGRTVTKAERPESFKYYQEGMTKSQLRKRQRALHPDRLSDPTREQMDEFAEISDVLQNAENYGLKLASFFSRAFFY